MILPSNVGGPTTREVGVFDAAAGELACWLCAPFDSGSDESWAIRDPGWAGREDALKALSPLPASGWRELAYAFVPMGRWSVLLNNTVLGTDVGLIPGRAARDLGCRAIRAVRIEAGEYRYPAHILEVFGPEATARSRELRLITSMNDGGRWRFVVDGTPLAFERLDEYEKRVKADRFTGERLIEYLRAFGVPREVASPLSLGVDASPSL
jgi:hypothetical protein